MVTNKDKTFYGYFPAKYLIIIFLFIVAVFIYFYYTKGKDFWIYGLTNSLFPFIFYCSCKTNIS